MSLKSSCLKICIFLFILHSCTVFLKYALKNISADEDDVKQQDMKEPVAMSYNIL